MPNPEPTTICRDMNKMGGAFPEDLLVVNGRSSTLVSLQKRLCLESPRSKV